MLTEDSSIKLQTINQLLNDYEATILIDIANATGSFSEVDSPQYSIMSSNQGSEFIHRTRRVEEVSPTAPSTSIRRDSNEEQTEKFSKNRLIYATFSPFFVRRSMIILLSFSSSHQTFWKL
jgi:hypothetical protein